MVERLRVFFVVKQEGNAKLHISIHIFSFRYTTTMTPDEKLKHLENTLWTVASQLWANGELKPSEYTFPVLWLIFLKYADKIFQETTEKLIANQKPNRFGTIEELTKTDYHKEGVVYMDEKASYDYLLNQPEGTDYGKIINEAMKVIEKDNPRLEWVLPKQYWALSNDNLVKLLKTFTDLDQIEGDNFWLIYEYFMGKFESEWGQKGWEFFTPRSIVKLIVNIIEPFKGKIFDPACGSWGMFTQSLQYIKDHKDTDIVWNISVYGQEIKTQTIRLAQMNLAINGLEWDIREWSSMYTDEHNSIGKFDYVMANPPFNVSWIDKEKINNDPRYSFGIPWSDNANYLWIQIFANALKENTGRAWFVMANSASDARNSELEIRKKLIEDGVVDVMVSVWPNFFYTVTLPCTLWFFDKSKKWTDREKKVLFIDAKDIYRQVDRSHREFTDDQIKEITDIVQAYRQEEWTEQYEDVKGLCKVVSIDEVREQGYSLNPGRYVGVKDSEEEEYDFSERLQELTDELKQLSEESHGLESDIMSNVESLLDR